MSAMRIEESKHEKKREATTRVSKYKEHMGKEPVVALELFSAKATSNLILFAWLANLVICLAVLLDVHAIDGEDVFTYIVAWILGVFQIIAHIIGFYIHVQGDGLARNLICGDWSKIEVAGASALFISEIILVVCYIGMLSVIAAGRGYQTVEFFVLREGGILVGTTMFLLFSGGFKSERLSMQYCLVRGIFVAARFVARMVLICGHAEGDSLQATATIINIIIYIVAWGDFKETKNLLEAENYIETRYRQIAFRFTTFVLSLSLTLGLFVEALTYIAWTDKDYTNRREWPFALLFMYPMLIANIFTVLLVAFLPPNEDNVLLKYALGESTLYTVPWDDVTLALAACSDVYALEVMKETKGTKEEKGALSEGIDCVEGTAGGEEKQEAVGNEATEDSDENKEKEEEGDGQGEIDPMKKEEEEKKKKKGLEAMIWKKKKKNWTRLGLRNLERIVIEATDTNCLISEVTAEAAKFQSPGWTMKERDIVISFRGTHSLKNLITDLKAWRTMLPEEMLKSLYKLEQVSDDKVDKDNIETNSTGLKGNCDDIELGIEQKQKNSSIEHRLSRKDSVWVKMEPETMDQNTFGWGPGAKVHSGFLASYMSVRGPLFEKLDPILSPLKQKFASSDPASDRKADSTSGEENVKRSEKEDEGKARLPKILLTGHSLGGALATLAALELTSRYHGEYEVQLINVASPLVGDRRFVELFNSHLPNALRVVFDRDPVPDVPDFLWMYYHVGHEVFIDGHGNALVDRSPIEKAFIRGTNKKFGFHKLPAYNKAVDVHKRKFLQGRDATIDTMWKKQFFKVEGDELEGEEKKTK